MKKLTLTLFLLAFTFLFSQTHRFIYQLDIKNKYGTEKMNMVLDIDKENVKFYDYAFLEMDSISKKAGELWQTNSESDQLILRKANTNKNTQFHDSAFDYLAIDSEDNMIWNISKETKNIGEYKLQKATTKFGGRNWTAWFCEQIPFQEGPYKFRGLPALIFEISDNDGNFKYSLVKSINLPETFETNQFLENHYDVKPVKVNLKQYHKIKLNYYNDPVLHMREALDKGGTVSIDGENITNQNQLDIKRKSLQERIKNNYNPIELDKAIPYPKA